MACLQVHSGTGEAQTHTDLSLPLVGGGWRLLCGSVVLMTVTTAFTEQVPWARCVRFSSLYALAQSSTAEATELPAPEPAAASKPRPGSGGPTTTTERLGWGRCGDPPRVSKAGSP